MVNLSGIGSGNQKNFLDDISCDFKSNPKQNLNLTINIRNELYNTCRHRLKELLSNVNVINYFVLGSEWLSHYVKFCIY